MATRVPKCLSFLVIEEGVLVPLAGPPVPAARHRSAPLGTAKAAPFAH
jgi:hypothetical protein